MFSLFIFREIFSVSNGLKPKQGSCGEGKIKRNVISTFQIDFESNGIESKNFICNRVQCTFTSDDETSIPLYWSIMNTMRAVKISNGSNRNRIVFTLFRLIWIQTAYDCVDDYNKRSGRFRDEWERRDVKIV